MLLYLRWPQLRNRNLDTTSMSIQTTLELAEEIKKSLTTAVKFERLILIGNFHKSISSNNELDFVAIISNKVNKFEFVSKSSALAINYIAKYNFLIQFFPIYNADFISESNPFIKSIRRNGITI